MTVKVVKRARRRSCQRPAAPPAAHPVLLHDLGRGIRLLRRRWASNPDAPLIDAANPDFLGSVSTPRPPQHWAITSLGESAAYVREMTPEEHENYLYGRFLQRREDERLERIRVQALQIEARRMRQYADHPHSLVHRGPDALPVPVPWHQAVAMDEAEAVVAFPHLALETCLLYTSPSPRD